ncbi:hypothetical protein HHK36_011645 [Tetracentron sinense]|uniref:Uncharacterized protein n=1 Tax=Tetracentron sinense TaxID=13715 RepID=A0A834ZC32_TETSI|nr:hypothetical protein HHK36_011645 [Tetracentron sinense]
MWAMIQRCETLPNILLRAQFIRSSVAIFLWKFFKVLLQHCKEAEFTAGHVEDDVLMTVSISIDAARYCEFILQEWSEDVNFLEMKMVEDDSNIHIRDDMDDHGWFFGEHIKRLIELQTDWLMDIMANLLCQFNTLSLEHVQNREQWGREDFGLNIVWGATDFIVSADFVEALDVLRSQLHILQARLNLKDFLDLWRSIADGLDQFIFGSIIMSDTRFSAQGVNQFGSDMRALFIIFQSFSARPESFFSCIRDSLKLLEMRKEDVKHLQAYLSNNEKRIGCLQLYEILHISPDQTEKILRNKKFGD